MRYNFSGYSDSFWPKWLVFGLVLKWTFSRFQIAPSPVWLLKSISGCRGGSASRTAGMCQYRCQSYQKAAHHQSEKWKTKNYAFLRILSVEYPCWGSWRAGWLFWRCHPDQSRLWSESCPALSQMRPRAQRSAAEEARVPPSKRWVIWAFGQIVMPAGQCTDTSFHPPLTIWW